MSPGYFDDGAGAIGIEVAQALNKIVHEHGGVVVNNVRISIDKTTTVNFELQRTVVELGKEITVVAERPLVQMDLTSTEAVVGSEVIQQLPVERFEDVVNLQAGVVEGHAPLHVLG